jgi:hypothetical protein
LAWTAAKIAASAVKPTAFHTSLPESTVWKTGLFRRVIALTRMTQRLSRPP